MFGKGDVRGVIAPETATAGQKPGSLLPTVAFGIPGSGPMALLLGAFLIVGLRPGREMLNQNLDLTFMMVWTVVAGNIIAALISLALQRYLVRLCYIRATVIAPTIITFMAIGATLATKEFDDLLIFAFFGLLGYIFKHSDWPRVPLIIGLVLGYISETYLLISVNLYGPNWLWERPIVVVVEALIALSVGVPILRKYCKKSDDQDPGKDQKGVKRVAAWSSSTWYVGLFMAGFAAVAVILADQFDIYGRIFPRAIGIPVALFAILHTVTGFAQGVKVKAEQTETFPREGLLARRIEYFAWVIGLLVLIVLFGHHVGPPLFIIVFMTWHKEKLWLTAIFAVSIWAFVYFMLDRMIHIHFPQPLLASWLGL